MAIRTQDITFVIPGEVQQAKATGGSVPGNVKASVRVGARRGAGGRGGRGRGGAPPKPITVTVTLPSGEKVEGPLLRIDDFLVTLRQADGTVRSIRRTGDLPKVEIADPLQAHRALLAEYSDKDMHDVTAYLATLK